MLHDTYTQLRPIRETPRPVGRERRDPSAVRMNPWLLWRPERPHAPQLLSVAEMAECACPDLCNRDHPNE